MSPEIAKLEAATAVFGAHGMGQDTILRNLALLNVLWDGGEMAIDRRSKPSFVLRGRRLTFGLMVQPESLRGYGERAGTLPRGTGFIARFLIAWPGSTHGTRAYRLAPEAMPQVALFEARIRELLAQPLATDAHGCLTPAVLDLSPQARAEWIRVNDEVERELGARGAFRGVRDVAAKAAQNAARLAALFHVPEHGASGTIAVRGDPRRGLGFWLAFERSTAPARPPGHAAVARRGDPARCLAAQRSAGQRHRSRADEADLPVRSELRPGQPRPARRPRHPQRARPGADGGRWAPAGRGD